jgi:uncharacterized protein
VSREKWQRLEDELRRHRRVLVAYSGGCDSAFLAAAARRTLGKANVLAVTAVSASLPAEELRRAEKFAGEQDIDHRLLTTRELENPAYAANPSNRCFFCKNELFSRLAPIARDGGYALADGLNVSDRSEIRPGVQAAQDWNVAHPLDDAGLEKKEIRILSRWLKLATWNKPASPCLSSRIPYGTRVTREILSQIENAEAALHAEGFSVTRVRHHGELARIEVPEKDLFRLQEPERWRRLEKTFQTLGYQKVIADARGFRSGGLNKPAPS